MTLAGSRRRAHGGQTARQAAATSSCADSPRGARGRMVSGDGAPSVATRPLCCFAGQLKSAAASGINFHGGHHDVLVEDCELSYTGDDPIGLWPVSTDAKADRSVDCQRNIVIRNNTARWPRQYPGQKAGQNGSYARDEAACDCSDETTANGTRIGGLY